VTGIEVTDVVLENGQLIANAILSLGGESLQGVDVPIRLPLRLFAEENMEGAECPILNLEIGPLYLDLLGLNVELDDCDGGPVVLTITALPGDNALLGNLLCAVAGLLNDELSLEEILGMLEGGLLGDVIGDDLLGGIRDLLNDFFDQLLGGNMAEMGAMASHPGQGKGKGKGHGQGPGQGPGQGHRNRCDILDLEFQGVTLTLLGLEVATSDVCLLVYAERGQGNLLGNLLCGVVGLLDRPVDTGNAVNALLNNVNRLLGRLGL
jgi:hypothetical protein